MPPKKKDEDVDLSTLPPWLHLTAFFSFKAKKSRAAAFTALLKASPRAFQKTISREDIVNFAKEKGLYTDLALLTEKQRKDAKFMDSIAGTTELTAKVLVKALGVMVFEMDVAGRKAKKDKLEGKESGEKKGADKAKDAKSNGVGDNFVKRRVDNSMLWKMGYN